MIEYDMNVKTKVIVLDANNGTKYQPKRKAEEGKKDFLKTDSKIRRVDIEKYFEKR